MISDEKFTTIFGADRPSLMAKLSKYWAIFDSEQRISLIEVLTTRINAAKTNQVIRLLEALK